MFGNINNYANAEKLKSLSLDYPLKGNSNLYYIHNYFFNKNRLKQNKLDHYIHINPADLKLFLNTVDYYFKHIFLENSEDDIFNYFKKYFNNFLNTLGLELDELYNNIEFPKEDIFKEIKELVYANNPELFIVSK